MQVYTTQMAYGPRFDGSDIVFIDTTIKSGHPWMAPDWSFLMDYKEGNINQEQYRDLFAKKIVRSWTDHKDQWQQLLNHDTIALGCYCKAGTFCHRYILVEYLRIYCVSKNVDFEYCGEWLG